MDVALLFHLGFALTGLMFVLAFVWAGHRDVVPPGMAGWIAAAFGLDLVGSLVLLVGAAPPQAGTFLSASLHALVPVMLLGGLRSGGTSGDQSGMLLSLVAVTLGWTGAAMTAGLGPLWVDMPVHLFRGLLFLACAWVAWHRFRGRGTLIVALTLASAGVAFIGPPALLLTDPTAMPFALTAERVLLYGLGLAILVTPFEAGGRSDRQRKLTAVQGALMEAVDQAALVFGPDGCVSWANAAACRLFGAEPDGLTGREWRRLLTGLVERGADLDALPLVGEGIGGGAAPAQTVVARSMDGAELLLEVARVPLAEAPPGGVPRRGQEGESDIAVLAVSHSGIGHLTAMARLSLEIDADVLGGVGRDRTCDLVCRRIAEIEDASLVWVALRDRAGVLTLTAAGGVDATVMQAGVGAALPGWLSEAVEPAVAFRAPRLLSEPARGIGPAAVPDAFDDAMLDLMTRRPSGAVFPLASGDTVLGVLVVHPDSGTMDRGARLRCDVVARRLGNALRLGRETGFLRLQAAAMSVAANAIFITDRDGRIEWANEAFTALSGFSTDEVRGKTPHILFSGHQDPATYEDLWETIKTGDIWRGELVERRKDGSLYTVQQTITPMRGPDDDAIHYVAVHEDISERKRAEERIRYLSNYDTLTRLPNRTLFRDRLHQAVQQARRVQGTVSVLFVDLTQFSRVNDTLGHDLGDQILMTVGSRINAAVAEEVDTVARMGGDEFAIIQSGHSGAEAAATLARRLARIIETPVEVGENTVNLRATVGIAMYPGDGTDPDNLIKNADLAMHRVARAEGEDYRFFSNDMNNEARIRLDLEADLRRALERGELENYYQPQYDMSGALVGMEALVRWRHPIHGLVPPGQFITVAEESGLIMPLGEGVLNRALSDLAGWRAAGLPLIPVAVNISAVQFRDAGLVDRICQALESHRLPPDALDLELTESMLMGEHAGAVAFLSQLAAEGFRIAIDDFGTGYSSLNYLKRFPVHKLKIDQSFVQHLREDTNDTILVRAIINLGHSLGMTVIAEGVETEDQLAYLRQEGADVVQGYLFSRPVPRDEMDLLLRAEAGVGVARGAGSRR
ncbi:EAL domain-containing protein [Roseospira goensis]|uniref:Diguanylate cyclase (GGDEF)-like protein/PAS domain S-box-containing protein n=1 Tax=Roseospira goensis TaxID=391922 RepID=A0A7W6S0N0_9PROT|nr:EAL domain-containing protein [Roseospira goensis]MBB4286715.1 diguanylate cyclase (GGDEF)-like protein/PAS domain S-box-containing protein [Roseospira goensis]